MRINCKRYVLTLDVYGIVGLPVALDHAEGHGEQRHSGMQ